MIKHARFNLKAISRRCVYFNAIDIHIIFTGLYRICTSGDESAAHVCGCVCCSAFLYGQISRCGAAARASCSKDAGDFRRSFTKSAEIQNSGINTDVFHLLTGQVYRFAGCNINGPSKVKAIAAGLVGSVRRIGVHSFTVFAGAAVRSNVCIAERIVSRRVRICNRRNTGKSQRVTAKIDGNTAIAGSATGRIIFKGSKVCGQREPCCRAAIGCVQTAEFGGYSAGTLGVNDAGVTQSAGVKLGETICRIIGGKIAFIVVGTGKLIPCSAIDRNLHSASLWVAVERIAVDHKVNAVGIGSLIFDTIFKVELNKAAERTQRDTGRFRSSFIWSYELCAEITPTGVVGELAKGQIAHNRGGCAAGQGVGLGAAGNGVGCAASDNDDGEGVVLRGRDRVAVVRAVLQGRALRSAVHGNGGRILNPQRELAGNLAGTVAASDGAGRAVPSDEHRVTGGDADGHRHIIVEIVGIAFAKLVDNILVRIRRRQRSTISHSCCVGVGRILTNEYSTTGRVRNILAECRDDKVAALIGRCGERCGQHCAVCCAVGYSQIIVVNCTMKVCACRILDALKVCASNDNRGNIAAVSVQGLGRCSRYAERKQRYGYCQHKDQCQRAGVENLFHA